MKAKIIILLMALMAIAGMQAQVPADTARMVLVQDSSYVARQTAEVERLLAEAYLQAVLDSIEHSYRPTPRFRTKDLILPASLIAVGTVAVWEHNLCKAKNYAYEHLEASHTHADDYLQWAPLAVDIGMAVCGKKSNFSPTEDMLASLTSVAFMYGVGAAMKYTIRERRPYDVNERNSFPSGHVARAFRSAEAMRIRYGNWWGAGGYALATTVAYLRLRNGKHWVNDVIGGAGLGILSTRVGYWLAPWEKKVLGLEGKRRTVMVAMPYYDAVHKGAGAMVALQF
ncbi:MAG: phosphatase PAP2 family protein [Muribaculaceae bacterium]